MTSHEVQSPRSRQPAATVAAIIAAFVVLLSRWWRHCALVGGLALLCTLVRADVPVTPAEAADSYYWRGVAALDAGRPGTAAELFERALMENPDHAGAWFDYGLTLCRLGETASCRALLAEALARFGSPPLLAGRDLRLDRVFNGEVHGGLGYSSNLGRGVAGDAIHLFIGGSAVLLPLAASMRPHATTFAEAGADLRWRQPRSGFEIGLTAYQRFAASGAAPGLQALAVDAGWDWRPGQRVGLLAYRLEERNPDGSPAIDAAGLWWERAADPHTPRIAVTLENRDTVSPGYHYQVARLEAGQPLSDWGGRAGIELQATAETETRSDRPGAAQSRFALACKAPLAMTAARLELLLRGQAAWDAEPYSPLLGDSRRRTVLVEASARYTRPLSEQLSLRAELRFDRQTSNLELFRYQERVASATLAYRW